MKLKYVGESDHIVCFVGSSYVYFDKTEAVEVSELDGAKLLAQYVGQFEKEESKAKAAPKAKILPEVIEDGASK